MNVMIQELSRLSSIALLFHLLVSGSTAHAGDFLFQPKSSTNHVDLNLLLEGLHSLSRRHCRSRVYLYDGLEKLLAC
ncbi:hypothetical protein FJTKL_02365 [Diaporthe vaccinii]|uniref:Uncharacterized protein n=1 Tax=Diaporthe vaccinii TaxID=105482 RepID=A0ABR4F3U8_9PEZI